MRPRNPRPNHTRRHERSSWWLLLVCALLLAAPSGAAPLSLSQARQSTAQVEAVFAMLQAEAPLESRAALQVLCERAGLDDASTAQLLSSYERWSHIEKAQKAPPSTCSAPPSTSRQPTDASRTLLTTVWEPSEAPVRTHARILLFLE